MVFDKYANYYDLLYYDKKYDLEAEYISKIIKKYSENTVTILDLGCGTGKHAELLSKKGFYVQGLDMSEKMIEHANKRAVNNNKLNFTVGNIQDFSFNRQFDVITALFHVMSYQNNDECINKCFSNIYKHLKKDGIFVFDCWYGPAVLLQQPEIRVKRLENEKIKLVRIAEPVLRENDNIVEVHYDIFIKNKKDNNIFEISEIHNMRYFFENEIKTFVKGNGFKLLDDFEFLTGNRLSRNTWSSCFVIKK